MTALHSQPYKDAIDRVVQRRLDLGWSQEDLARRLPRYERSDAAGPTAAGAHDQAGQLQSFVSKFEQCQRRLDVIEFEHVCHVLGLRVAEALDEHNWTGAPPPALVPLARQESTDERRHRRRVKPRRKQVRPGKPGDAPGPPWPPRALRGGAGRSVEAPGHELPEAADADAPPEPPPLKASQDRKPRQRRRQEP